MLETNLNLKPEPQPHEEIDLATLRFLNESAIREHALACSKQFRAGKFKQVGSDFIDEVKADVEQFIRELRNKYPTLHLPLELGSRPEHPNGHLAISPRFSSGALIDKVALELNRAIGRIIQNKVQRQPSTGMTLGRTR